MTGFLISRNPVDVDLREVPVFAPDAFADRLGGALAAGGRLIALMGLPPQATGSGTPGALAAVARDDLGTIGLARLAPCLAYPSLTPLHPQAQALERALWEEWGIVPQGHPWLKPLRRTVPGPETGDFFRVEGDEVHEVAVGPVHAGIIEPGHFRFQCHGETVFHLEIRLGYQHRGALGMLLGAPSPRWAAVAESVSGDTAVGGALAHALCLEALAGTEATARAQALRAVALELERIAYHVGDLGALGGDVGFLPTAQHNGRIRGDFLNLLLTLAGNRHGRGFVRAGGVLADLEPPRLGGLLDRFELHCAEARRSIDLLFGAPSVLARFEGTGRVEAAAARALGLVGVAARASGVEVDVRAQHPFGAYRFQQVPVALGAHGDVHARALVRQLEADRSAALVRALLASLPGGSTRTPCPPPRPHRVALAAVEAWRGELVHARVTDGDGRIVAAEIVDPSVHNWFGLAMALRGEGISDFPLCNKSFNLAYAGHDL
ncbi:MAG: NADH-quinone oxidoreductase subunit C [Deferrisomatales bacterium]